jgi:hypothetical protein
MESRMMDKDSEGWNMKEQEEDILGRKEVVVVQMRLKKKNQNKVEEVEEVRHGASLVHNPQMEVGECDPHTDHHDSHNHHHNNHHTRSHKDQGKVGHSLDLEEVVVYGTCHDHLVLLGVVGHVADHQNHDHDHVVLLVCLDLCHGMNQYVLKNDHLYPLSNGQNELEEVEHG